ncbi:YkuS family protein [Desertibacillus haloalkaliphilus]|uniref:YkuS family protein n=1 Tax=Desertibacillus haloalkaliphilus TaxID=1328930 RepID=UPI001C276EE7|nr:YkuS family protein [Desertibacillus haloalkaliphilus]MBU8906767.1 YkuS family protein [Desertibacillus haloalkaliphilus]
MPKVGIEQSLTNVQEELQSRGYDVVQLKQEQDAKGCDCCVITGQDENMMGIQNTITTGSVINAHGMNANEICERVDQTLQGK